MVAPVGADSFAQAVVMCAEVYQQLHRTLKAKGLATGVGDEGGFAPGLSSNEEPMRPLVEAIEAAGYRPGDDLALCLDRCVRSYRDAPLRSERLEVAVLVLRRVELVKLAAKAGRQRTGCAERVRGQEVQLQLLAEALQRADHLGDRLTAVGQYPVDVEDKVLEDEVLAAGDAVSSYSPYHRRFPAPPASSLTARASSVCRDAQLALHSSVASRLQPDALARLAREGW